MKILFLNTSFLFCLLLFSCGKKEEKSEELPAGILSEEQFSRVLTDFALAESAANMNIKTIEVRRLDSVYAFDPLKENGVSQALYDSTVSFYVKRPDLYKKVYEKVLVALSEMQASRNSGAKDTAAK